ncbi:MAG: cupin, partial [Parvibaculales bacterium]
MSDKFASGNIFSKLGSNLTEEEVTSLLAEGGVRVERIVSTGQATPEGKWYDQEQDEWVILLRGGAGLRIESEK